MADVAKRFVKANPAATTDTLVATVTTDKKWILRNIHINNSGAIGDIILGLGGAALTLANRFVDLNDLAANASYDWSGFHVMEEGETIYVYAQHASFTVVISGVEVDA